MSEVVKDISRYLRDMADGENITSQLDMHVLIRAARVIEQKDALISELVGALESARRFVENGIEFGYIRMPDPDVNDSAKMTPGIIQAALTKARGQVK